MGRCGTAQLKLSRAIFLTDLSVLLLTKKKKLRKIEELEFQFPLMQHYGWGFQAVKVGNSEVQALHYVHGLYKRKEANHLCRNPKLYQLLESFYSWLGPRDSWSDWLHSATLTSTENCQKVWHYEISVLSLFRDLKDYCYRPERFLPSRRQRNWSTLFISSHCLYLL